MAVVICLMAATSFVALSHCSQQLESHYHPLGAFSFKKPAFLIPLRICKFRWRAEWHEEALPLFDTWPLSKVIAASALDCPPTIILEIPPPPGSNPAPLRLAGLHQQDGKRALHGVTAHPLEAKYVERWPSTTSAWAGWNRFDIPVDRHGGIHSLLRWPSRILWSLTCHQASQQENTYWAKYQKADRASTLCTLWHTLHPYRWSMYTVHYTLCTPFAIP